VSKRTLLLADDSVTIQKVVNLTFADEGIDVITVGDGDSAMQKLSESIPDVVLADVHMPGLSGYRICEIIRENPATKHLPVVLLVGSFEPFDENEAARVGANAFLTKPFQSIRQLVSQVSALIESSSNESPSQPEYQEANSEQPIARDTSDIDSLYQNSVTAAPSIDAEPAPAPADPGPSRYVDMGMDDEMIETSYGAEPAEVWTERPQEYSAAASGGEMRALESYAETSHEEIAGEPFAEEFDESGVTDVSDESHTQVTAEFTQDEEMELLELPPISAGETVEIRTPGGGTQLVNLTPELVDIIAEKVAEKLSLKN
jgi:CheY-like chemotaxis protein